VGRAGAATTVISVTVAIQYVVKHVAGGLAEATEVYASLIIALS